MNSIASLWRDNSPEELTIALCVVLAIFVALLFVRRLVSARLLAWARRSSAQWDDIMAGVIASTHAVFLFVIALLLGIRSLEIAESVDTVIARVTVLALLVQVGLWLGRAIDGWLALRMSASLASQDGSAALNLGILGFVARLLLWVILLLLALDNLGFNITTLVASLGIGGIAVALAVQNILGDLFGSLSIAIDKPFVVGDFIVIDDMMGTVRNVGLKSTRIQSLSGEELVFSNADLLKSRIRNYKRMQERRVVFNFSLHPGIPPEKLRRALAIVKDILARQEGLRVDRVHLQSIKISSLDFEVVYYMLKPDFNLFMDTQQEIYLAMVESFAAEDIAFAQPFQRLDMSNMPRFAPDEGSSVEELSGGTLLAKDDKPASGPATGPRTA